MKINFINETNDNVLESINLIKNIFKGMNNKHIMSVIFVDSEEIRRINRESRGIDKVTDVISFALNDSDFIIETQELGDIFICLDRAYEQALEYGHSKDREIGFLVVHGYLHLLGYDHQTKEDEEKMMNEAEKILKRAGLTRGTSENR